MECSFDRAAEDLGNVVALEHVNVTVPDQQVATIFYVTGLGLTRDPFLMTSTINMWINIGRSQFHLPGGKPQILRGHVGVVIPNRQALVQRLSKVRKFLDGTRFDFQEHDAYVDAICPWGNRIRCYEPDPRFGPITLGIGYVEFDVPTKAADGIARFYQQIINTPAEVVEDSEGRHTRVAVGIGQNLIFRETDQPLPAYDGHHIQVYVADFSGPYKQLLKRGLIFEESDQHQYRFKDIVDPKNGKKVLYTIEHEVRSMKHPIYLRPLVNRNPAQNNMNYAPGFDAWTWGMPNGD